MSLHRAVAEGVDLTVENVGGIDRASVTFPPGVTVLTGRNATNRTSLLQAVMAGIGSENVSIKADADEARVELTADGNTYTRTLERTEGGVSAEGEPYLADAELADLFVFLVESNEARRAVELDRDLRDIIMRPVDTAAIEDRVADLESERAEINQELETLRSLRRELPKLEQRREDLTARIDDKRAELEAIEEAIDDSDRGAPGDASATDLDSALDSLREVREELEDVRYEVDTERESIAALETEIENQKQELADLPAEPMAEVGDVTDRLDELRSARDDLNATINDVQKVIQFNEAMLDGTNADTVAALRDADGGDIDPADEGHVNCWTCGSEVESESVRATTDRLREFRAEKLQKRTELQSEMRKVKTEKATYEEQQRQRTQLETRCQRASAELADRRDRLEELVAERDRLAAEVEDHESDLDRFRDEGRSELLELHREANQVEFEIGQLRSDLEDVTDQIDELESRLNEWESLRARRETVTEELDEQRSRIERVEREAIAQFNEHMATVLRVLDYGNLARIWLEQRQDTDGDGNSTFTLHVVRGTADGTTYEDSVDHLSESEREVTGLVFALAGYLAHDVHEVCPFLLLDSIEAIDSDRIARLIEYLSDHAEYVVVALLEEDAQALSDDYERIDMS